MDRWRMCLPKRRRIEKLVKEQGIWAVRKHCLFCGIIKIHELQAMFLRNYKNLRTTGFAISQKKLVRKMKEILL